MKCSLCNNNIPTMSQDFLLLAYPVAIDEPQAFMEPVDAPVYACKACLLSTFEPQAFTALRRLGLIWGSISGCHLAKCD